MANEQAAIAQVSLQKDKSLHCHIVAASTV